MRYPTKVLVSCFALIVVVGIVCFYPEGRNSTVCCDSNVSNSSTTAQANEGMTRPFSPLLKVEIDESVREDMYQSAKKIRDKRWSPIHDVNKGADAHKIFNALFLSTTIPLWRVPNVGPKTGIFSTCGIQKRRWDTVLIKKHLITACGTLILRRYLSVKKNPS